MRPLCVAAVKCSTLAFWAIHYRVFKSLFCPTGMILRGQYFACSRGQDWLARGIIKVCGCLGNRVLSFETMERQHKQQLFQLASGLCQEA